VSRDTKFVHLAWQRDEKALANVRYLMGSDPTGAACHAYNVLDEATGLALRGTYIISPQGVLLNSEMNFYNLGRNIDELIRKIRANILLAGSPAEAVPAQWKRKGDVTLKPSIKMVGRVAEAMKKK